MANEKVNFDQDVLKEAQKKLERALSIRYQMTEGVKRTGNEMIVPSYMSLTEASKALANAAKLQEQDEQVAIQLAGHPHDCCHAFYKAMNEIYGQLTSSTNYGFFGMPLPGRTITVPVSCRESIKLPIGNAQVPGLPIEMNISFVHPDNWDRGDIGLTVVFTAKRKYTPLIKDIESRTREILASESIFRGKPIDSRYKFLKIGAVKDSKVIYSDSQRVQLEANLFTIIANTEKVEAAGVPVKRGILLHGPYGTGKTLTALHVASICQESGWTFILVKNGDDIDEAIELAQELQPCCVFFEDIDAVASTERNVDVNAILNTIDGVLSKDSKVITVLTTNHIEQVNPAMLRPGRLDAVIMLGALDKKATIHFIEQNASKHLSGTLDADAIYTASEGYTPAFLKEAVSKAVLYSLARGEAASVTSDDIVNALVELRPQFDLMQGPKKEEKRSFIGELGDMIEQYSAKVTEKVETLTEVTEAMGQNWGTNSGWERQNLTRNLSANAKKVVEKGAKKQ